MCRQQRSNRPPSIPVWLVAVVTAVAAIPSVRGQAIVPGTDPGSRAGQPQPQPGQPEARPDFAPPQPNRGTPVAATSTGLAETPQFLVGAIVIRYEFDHPELPGVDDLQKTEVTFSRVVDGYVSQSTDLPEETMTLEDIALRPAQRFSAAAINAISRAIQMEINRRGVFGVVVTPSDREFTLSTGEEESRDLRKPGQTAVTLIVRALLVREMRTVAFGDRIPPERRINADEHQEILQNAPVRVYQQDDLERRDLFRKDLLDNYVFRLNRHPGRRVDIAVSAADTPQGQDLQGLAVDLLVTENDPWFVYFQVSNTGTEQTSEWRERFGFVHNQLTGSDDILNLDYITSGFDSSHAFLGSYERPVYGDWLRGRIFGNWNEYTASDVGQTNEVFTGEGFLAGGELIANVYQHRELFVDLTAGVRYQYVETTNEAVQNLNGNGNLMGKGDFLLPSFGARLDRSTETAVTTASIGVEFNLSDVTNKEGNLDSNNGNRPFFEQLGRANPDDAWSTLNWDIGHSFFLDPLYFGADWENTDQSTGGQPSLAHELALSFRGQYAFGARLIPNFEQVLGGMFSVRGYPESIVAGDSVYVGTVEYRLHLPQALGYDSEPGALFGKPFRWRPQSPYGRADWDLVLKAFLDAGYSEISDKLADERNHTLVGTGIGIEFLYKRNLSLRLDWGFALQDVDNPDGSKEVSTGDNEVHFMATILF